MKKNLTSFEVLEMDVKLSQNPQQEDKNNQIWDHLIKIEQLKHTRSNYRKNALLYKTIQNSRSL